ncbi:MAG: hypothetical protein R3F35_17860 [Myxococcota bacterium]
MSRRVARGAARQASSDRATPPRPWPLPAPHAVVGLMVFGLIGWGIANVDALTLAADDGLGYALGPFGLACMTLLLGYSVRKRARWLRQAGPLSVWLEIHLILGLIGPTAILYHARFGSSSMNASVAMFCMLAVAGSGVGGRFVYGRIHRGLAGPRRSVDSLRRDARQQLAPIETLIEQTPRVRARLERFEATAFGPLPWALRLTRPFWLRPWSWRVRIGAVSALTRAGDGRFRRGDVRRALRGHLSAKSRAVELAVYERVFALWHAVHVPLCAILFLSAVVHVVAVHLY